MSLYDTKKPAFIKITIDIASVQPAINFLKQSCSTRTPGAFFLK